MRRHVDANAAGVQKKSAKLAFTSSAFGQRSSSNVPTFVVSPGFGPVRSRSRGMPAGSASIARTRQPRRRSSIVSVPEPAPRGRIIARRELGDRWRRCVAHIILEAFPSAMLASLAHCVNRCSERLAKALAIGVGTSIDRHLVLESVLERAHAGAPTRQRAAPPRSVGLFYIRRLRHSAGQDSA